jgi:hypothetical protein
LDDGRCLGRCLLPDRFRGPDESDRYFDPACITRIATEAFAIRSGLLKAFFWDIEFQRENETPWEPIRKWKLIETDATAEGWGMRPSTFDGKPAIVTTTPRRII